MSPHAFSTSSLLAVLAPAAETSALFLVPSAEGLSAEHEVLVFDDGRLYPGVCVGVDFSGGGVESLEIGEEIVLRFGCHGDW